MSARLREPTKIGPPRPYSPRVRALLLLILAGCSTSDVCAPFDGQTCIALTLSGDSAQLVDRLGITVDGVFNERFSPPDGPRQPATHFPVAVAVLPGQVFVPITIEVRAIFQGFTRAQAVSPPVLVRPGEHLAVSLDLGPPGGGTDLRPAFDLRAGFDFAPSPDLAPRFDLAPGFDFAPGPDLLTPDLAPPPFCASVTVSTLAGDGTAAFQDATGTSAHFQSPLGVAVDSSGNVLVADYNNNRIRKIAPGGVVTTLAGNGAAAFADGSGGPSGTTSFKHPAGVAVDTSNVAYVADMDNHRVRRVATDGTTTTLTGNGNAGFFDGTGGAAGTTQLNSPWGIAVNGNSIIYAADFNGHRIRKILIDGSTTTLAGTGSAGFMDGSGGTAQFQFPVGLTLSLGSILYVADYINNRIRAINANNGDTATLAGNGAPGTTDGTGGATGTAEFTGPIGVAVAPDGTVFVGEQNNSRIRKIALDGSTLTVTGSAGSGMQDGNGCNALFNSVQGIALSGKQLFVADSGNNRIRVVQLP
jgi:sugar lactone lactonase YvrE